MKNIIVLLLFLLPLGLLAKKSELYLAVETQDVQRVARVLNLIPDPLFFYSFNYIDNEILASTS